MENRMIPGVDVVLCDGNTYVMPPLSLGSLQVLETELSQFTGGVGSFKTVLRVALHSLKRNYPSMTREDLAGIVKEVGDDIVIEKPPLIDIGNMMEIMDAVLDISGLKRKEQEEKKSAAGKS